MAEENEVKEEERRSEDQDAALEKAFVEGKLPEEDRRQDAEQEWGDVVKKIQATDPSATDETESLTSEMEEEAKPEESVSAEERIQEQLWRDRKLPGQINHPDFGKT